MSRTAARLPASHPIQSFLQQLSPAHCAFLRRFSPQWLYQARRHQTLITGMSREKVNSREGHGEAAPTCPLLGAVLAAQVSQHPGQLADGCSPDVNAEHPGAERPSQDKPGTRQRGITRESSPGPGFHPPHHLHQEPLPRKRSRRGDNHGDSHRLVLWLVARLATFSPNKTDSWL